MKKLYTFILSTLLLGLFAGCATELFGSFDFEKEVYKADEFSAYLVDELEPVMTHSNPHNIGSTKLESDLPFGKLAAVYVLVDLPSQKTDEEFAKVKLTGQESLSLAKMIEVPVEVNTGIRQRTENIDGKINPYVIERAPFYIYEIIDPISDFDSELKITENRTLLRIEIDTEIFQANSKETISIDVEFGKIKKTLTWDINLYKIAKAQTEKKPYLYVNWHSNPNIALYHELDRDTEEHFQMIEKYADLMVKGRQNCVLIGWDEMFSDVEEGDNISPVLREEFLTRLIDIYQRAGLTHFEGGHFAARTGYNWLARTLTVRRKWLAGTAEADAYLEKAFEQLYPFLQKHNLTENWLQSLSDEPVDQHAKDFYTLSLNVRKGLPNVRILEATKSRQKIVGSLDIWCPTLDQYQLYRSFFLERQEAGEDVWVYSCLDPGGPWLNRLLDQERLRQVYIAWAASKFEIDGFLHWGLNQYVRNTDPFKQSVRPFFGTEGVAMNSKNQLPAGDSHIVYPGKNGPLSSTRLEAHRIGVEDYDLLELLKEINPKAWEEVIAITFTDFRTYSSDVSQYRKAKKALLKYLKVE